MSSQETSKEIKITINGRVILMPIGCAKRCKTIKNMLEDFDDDDDSEVPIPNTTPENIVKVIDFYKFNKDIPIELTEEHKLEMRVKPLEGNNLAFIKVPIRTLFEMILIANYLDYEYMLDICCKGIAEMIKGKTPEEIKEIFGVEGDFTDEEKQQVLKDNPWLENPEEPTTFSTDNRGGGSASTIANV